ncbi:MAG TPA: hypothetical protein PLV03_05695 [Clostridiales bacterium]|nr:hypothetical protein [Clostridiales bacterium]
MIKFVIVGAIRNRPKVLSGLLALKQAAPVAPLPWNNINPSPSLRAKRGDEAIQE